jgi:hypothetical protein
LKYGTTVIIGDWKSDDYGDWTLIELKSKNNITEGRILNNSILFESGKIFEFDNFEEMGFTKIGDMK